MSSKKETMVKEFEGIIGGVERWRKKNENKKTEKRKKNENEEKKMRNEEKKNFM